MKLSMLKPGQSARILEVGGEGALRQHFLDMGVIPGAVVTLIKLAPMGDPMELRIHGYELTLRVADAGQILSRTQKRLFDKDLYTSSLYELMAAPQDEVMRSEYHRSPVKI